MVFKAQDALTAAEAEYSPFVFEDLDGETFELPNPYMLKPAELREELGLEPDEEIWGNADPTRIMEALSPGAWNAVQALPLIVQNQLIEGWMEHCGLDADDVGKAQSRSSATKKGAKRSKPTSRTGGKTSGKSRSTSSAG